MSNRMNSRLKILYVGGFELPDKNAAAHRVLSNAKILENLGHEVILVGTSKDEINEKIQLTKSKVENFKTYSTPYPLNAKNWLFHIFDIEFIQKLDQIEKFDVIIAYNAPSGVLWKLINKYKNRNKIIISDITEWYSSGEGNLVRRFVKTLDTVFRMRFLNKRVDGLIVISSYLQNYYLKQNTILLPPLVDLNDPKWENNNLTNSHSTIKLIYSGSPGKGEKDNIVELVNVFNKLTEQSTKDVVLNIVGISKDFYLRELSNESVELSNKIKFWGKISHLEALNLLKESNYSIFLREKNRINMAGFPTKYVESISSGVPVITTDTSDISHYSKEGENTYIVQNIDQVLDILLNEIEYPILGREIDKNVFHYENYIGNMDKFLDTVLNMKLG